MIYINLIAISIYSRIRFILHTKGTDKAEKYAEVTEKRTQKQKARGFQIGDG